MNTDHVNGAAGVTPPVHVPDAASAAALGRQYEGLREAARALGETLEDLRKRLPELANGGRPPAAQPVPLDPPELFEFAPDAWVVTDRAGTILQANHAAAALLRTRKEFLAGKPLPFLVVEDDRWDFYTELNRLNYRGAAVGSWEARLQRVGNAEPVHVVLTAVALPGEGAAPAGFRWLLRDVTARKRMEESLRAEKSFADCLIDTARAFVLVLDDRGHLVRCNSYLREVTGHPEQDLLGRAWWSTLVAPEEHLVAQQLWFRALTRGQSEGQSPALLTREGARRTVAWSLKAIDRPQPDVPGQSAAVLALGHDITDLLEAQRRALQAERLAAIGQVVTGLAHESRNALQRSHACLERLRWKLAGNAEALDLLARVQHAQDDLLRLFEDLRLYASSVRLNLAPCDLAGVWREAFEQVTAVHPDREARLREETDGVDTRCQVDPFRLGQVFRNLFDNSLTAGAGARAGGGGTPGGGPQPDLVEVVVTCRAAQVGGRPALEVRVRDNGPGLNAEQRRRAFEPFYTTKPRGTGLGMAIAKRIVEAHGGQIALGPAEPPTQPPCCLGGEGGSAGGGCGAGSAPGAEFILTLPRDQP